MIPHLAGTGKTVVWRCHIGTDEPNEHSRAGWDFLEPYVTGADACVFSRSAYVPEVLRGDGDRDRAAVDRRALGEEPGA